MKRYRTLLKKYGLQHLCDTCDIKKLSRMIQKLEKFNRNHPNVAVDIGDLVMRRVSRLGGEI